MSSKPSEFCIKIISVGLFGSLLLSSSENKIQPVFHSLESAQVEKLMVGHKVKILPCLIDSDFATFIDEDMILAFPAILFDLIIDEILGAANDENIPNIVRTINISTNVKPFIFFNLFSIWNLNIINIYRGLTGR